MRQWDSIFGPNVDGETGTVRLASIYSGSEKCFHQAPGWLAPPLFEHEGSLTPRLHSGTLLPLSFYLLLLLLLSLYFSVFSFPSLLWLARGRGLGSEGLG